MSRNVMSVNLTAVDLDLLGEWPGGTRSDKLRGLIERDIAKDGAHPGPFHRPDRDVQKISVQVPTAWLPAIQTRCAGTEFGAYLRTLVGEPRASWPRAPATVAPSASRLHNRHTSSASVVRPSDLPRPRAAATPIHTISDMVDHLVMIPSEVRGPLDVRGLHAYLHPDAGPHDRDAVIGRAFGGWMGGPLRVVATIERMYSINEPYPGRPSETLIGLCRDSFLDLCCVPQPALVALLTEYFTVLAALVESRQRPPVDVHLCALRSGACVAIFARASVRETSGLTAT